jgi:hypothetical protein
MMNKNYDDLNWQKESIADTLLTMREEINPIIKSTEGDTSLQKIVKNALEKIDSLKETINEPFKIAVVGAQGTGKSTIINVLLAENVMIIDYGETEGGIIKLIFTEDPELEKKACIKYFTGVDEIYKEEFIDRSEFTDLINLSVNGKLKTDHEYRDSIAFFEIYSSNKLLRNVQFLNTPGMNSITADFLKKVRHLFIESDMILWMTKRNQILDSFNTSLIPQIYHDNKNIIGVLGFADELYLMDRFNGFANVLDEFFGEIEKNMLLRKSSAGEDRVCFFIYNGLSAASSLGMKNAILISDRSNFLPAEEAELKMLWNYIDHGFPFSDEGIDIVDKHLLWNEYTKGIDKDKVADVYKRDNFIEWLYKNDLIINEGEGCTFTDTGKMLLLESSMLPYIQNFAQENVFGNKLDKKISRVKEGFNNLYGDNNVLGDLKKKRNEYEKIIEKKNEHAAEIKKYVDTVKTSCRLEYRKWYQTKTQRYSNQMSKQLAERVISDINEKISKKDFGKELLNLMIPKMFRSDDGPVARIVSEIIETGFEDIIAEKTERITHDAIEEMQNIITEVTMAYWNSENIKGKDIKPGDNKPTVSTIEFKFDISELKIVLDRLKLEIGKKIVILMKKIAASDMRKKGMNKFKKFFIKMFREILRKLGIEFGKKIAAKAPSKTIPVIGWALLVKDIIDIGVMVNEMLNQLKDQLQITIKDNQEEFYDNFKDILEPAYNEVQNAIFDEFEKTMMSDDKEIGDALDGIKNCDKTIDIFDSYKIKIGKKYGE